MSTSAASDPAVPEGLDVDGQERERPTSTAGLTEEEARARLEEVGYNELTDEERHPLVEFLAHFWGPIPWMIEAAAILSAVVGDWTDFSIITVLLVANAGVGFWEEYQAGNAIAELKEKLAPVARVRRGGTWKTIPAREVVPGDRIRIRMGDVVPADAELLEGDPLEVDQSALTGESLPVTRGPGDTVYAGSTIGRGEIEAVVGATGTTTYFGRTAELVQDSGGKSHFQRAVLRIGDYLIVLALALVVLILAVSLFRGDSMLDTLRFALVLTVAAIPVAMPTVLSVTMAVGARLLSTRQAIVSRLAAIEEMAGIDVLCTDKTGTLTQNMLTLGDPYVAPDVDGDEVLVCAALASREEDEDPIDRAVLAGLADPDRLSSYSVTDFKPFDPVGKRTEATVRGPDGKTFRVSKGAPQVILAMARPSDDVAGAATEAIDAFASRGYRALGVARSADGGRWELLGILSLFDPPREDSKETIAEAIKMGLRVKMVTGDQVAIAREIAGRLDLGQNIIDAEVFGTSKQHESGRLADAIESADGFAQVFPEHKYHIVDVLQQRGHIVGMTGDGVNDAPALKKADAGVAVSGATAAARAAADVVLVTPGLSVIVEAIRESRRIFRRMTNYAKYRIAETIRVLLMMTLSILIFNFYPVTAVMIVLLALLNDGAILSISYDRAEWSRRPTTWDMRDVLSLATSQGLAGVVATFGIFYLGREIIGLDRDTLQTLIYLKLSVAGHMTVFVTRTRGPFWSYRPSRILLVAVVGTQVFATIIAALGIFMPPLGWTWAGFVWLYATAWLFVNDRIKLAVYSILDNERPSFFLRSGG